MQYFMVILSLHLSKVLVSGMQFLKHNQFLSFNIHKQIS